MTLNASSKFYPGDKVAPKGKRSPQGTVKRVSDEDATVTVRWNGVDRDMTYPASFLRVLPPSEVESA